MGNHLKNTSCNCPGGVWTLRTHRGCCSIKVYYREKPKNQTQLECGVSVVLRPGRVNEQFHCKLIVLMPMLRTLQVETINSVILRGLLWCYGPTPHVWKGKKLRTTFQGFHLIFSAAWRPGCHTRSECATIWCSAASPNKIRTWSSGASKFLFQGIEVE